jgi:hypothetical protein
MFELRGSLSIFEERLANVCCVWEVFPVNVLPGAELSVCAELRSSLLAADDCQSVASAAVTCNQISQEQFLLSQLQRTFL